jgi:hypothetical protein
MTGLDSVAVSLDELATFGRSVACTVKVWAYFVPDENMKQFGRIAERVRSAEGRVGRLRQLVSIYKWLCAKRYCQHQVGRAPPCHVSP